MNDKSTLQAALEFVKEASSDCRKCENFASKNCPAFQQAVQHNTFDPDHLIIAIKLDQDGETLQPCPNR